MEYVKSQSRTKASCQWVSRTTHCWCLHYWFSQCTLQFIEIIFTLPFCHGWPSCGNLQSRLKIQPVITEQRMVVINNVTMMRQWSERYCQWKFKKRPKIQEHKQVFHVSAIYHVGVWWGCLGTAFHSQGATIEEALSLVTSHFWAQGDPEWSPHRWP